MFLKLTHWGECRYRLYNANDIDRITPQVSDKMGEHSLIRFTEYPDHELVVKESIDDILEQIQGSTESSDALKALKSCDDLLRDILHTLSEGNPHIEAIRCRLRDNVKHLHKLD